MSVAPFLVKTFDLVSDTENDTTVSWTPDGTSFVVWNPPEFSKILLPKHFKHNNFSSFVRQLNTYGFKKIDPDRWEFANGNFQRDRPDLMSGIQRRKGQTKEQPSSNALIASGQNVIEVGQYGGLVEEVEGLKRDKNVLMMELVHLRQQQQKSDTHVSAMKKRLDHTEKRLSEVIAFFSRVASNPAVLAQMVTAAQQSQAYLAGAEARRKKRRADGDTGDGENTNGQGALIPYKPIDVATFFQNLLVSPLPEAPDVQHPDGMADALEAQFNSIDLAKGEASVQPEGFTIQEHSSSADAGGDDSNGEDGDPDIQVPPALAGAIPSFCGIAPPAVDAATGNAGAAPAISSGNAEQSGAFDLAQLPATGAAGASPGMFSGSIPLPDAAGMSLDEMDVPADLLLDGTIGDMFKGAGSSLGELPEFKDEGWNNIMDDDFGMPPPMQS